jgi:hypothetical protein
MSFFYNFINSIGSSEVYLTLYSWKIQYCTIMFLNEVPKNNLQLSKLTFTVHAAAYTEACQLVTLTVMI